MTVEQLIKILETRDPEMQVIISYGEDGEYKHIRLEQVFLVETPDSNFANFVSRMRLPDGKSKKCLLIR